MYRLQTSSSWSILKPLQMTLKVRILFKFIVLLVTAISALAGCASTGRVLDYGSGSQNHALVEIPEYLHPKTLNGEKLKIPFLLSYPYEIKVPAGRQKLEFLYKQEWGGRGSKVYKESNIMQVEFDAKSGEHYRLEFMPPRSALALEKADQYLSKFTAVLTSDSGTEIPATATEEKAEGFKISLHGNTVDAESENSRLNSLKDLWQQSTEAERNAFMNWVISPNTR